MSRISVFGAGKVGTALARVAMSAGHSATFVGAAPEADTRLIAGFVAPGALVASAHDAVARMDIAVLAIPLHRYRTLDPVLFVGHVVIDAMNYWRPVNGILAEFEAGPTSEVIARYLAGSRVVKTLNHIGYHEVEIQGRPIGHPDRRALGVASDDAAAARQVSVFIDSLGYDAVTLRSLAASTALEPASAIFTGRLTASQLRNELRVPSSTQEPSWS